MAKIWCGFAHLTAVLKSKYVSNFDGSTGFAGFSDFVDVAAHLLVDALDSAFDFDTVEWIIIW